MAKVKVELNNQGVIELFKSAEVQGWLSECAKHTAETARGMSGKDYKSQVHNASFTAIANVYADTPETARDNIKNNTLTKALGNSGLFQTKPHL